VIRAARRVTLSLAVLVSVGYVGAYAQGTIADAETALRTGRYDDAISAFRGLVRGDPASARSAQGLISALAEVGRYGEAEEAARRYIDSAPSSPEIWNALGEVLYLVGRIEEAADAFARAMSEGASDSLDARLNLAVLRWKRGEHEEALSEFDGFIDVYNRSGGRELTSEELTAVATAVRYLGIDDSDFSRDALRAYDEAIARDPRNLEPRIRVGELLLEKYNSAEAAPAFADVLQLNPSHPRALLGQARTLRFDGRPGALELVDRSLEVNPNFVPARAFRAELTLELEGYDAAMREAERALDVNPNSLEALAVLAATRYLQGDHGAYEEARDRALALNPRYAGLHNRLAELSARNRLYFEAADFAGRALELDPKSWRGYALLGINQLRIGMIEEGRATLEIAFAGDPYDIWTKNTLDLLDTFEDYDEARTDRFLLAIDGKESELLSLYLSGLAEEAYDRLAARYGFRPRTPVRVEVYRSHADFSVRTVGLVGLGALGVSFGPVIAMDSPSARDAGEFNWGSTFWHELAHTFHLGMSGHRVPRWFSEGLAVYEERRARQGWGEDVTPAFLTAYLQGRLLPVGELNNGFARPAFPEQLMFSYYEASLVLEFIEQEAGAQALVAMLTAFRDGAGTAEAFEEVLNVGVDGFNDRFFEHFEERFAGPLAAMRPDRQLEHGQRPGRDDLEEWAREDPGDFYAQLMFGRTLFEEGAIEEAVVHFERAKALFPQYGGPASPYWHLALARRRRGALAEAAAELDALTAINGRDYRANLELAEIRETLGDSAAAAAALERLNYIYPYDMSLHARLAGLYSGLGEHAKAIRERKAVLALDPVDRAEALYQLARAYLEVGDLALARRTVIRALEDAPSFEAAQELLLEIRARGSGGGT
jgi:tetratricopeptide (TPR) repeat protein